MKLEIGMYVRTKNGKIWTIKSQKAISGHRKDIINASYNIIDLIEVGDYVNGGIVAEIKKTFIRMNGTKELLFQFIDKDKPEEIKSIVTKEQFESVQYKVSE